MTATMETAPPVSPVRLTLRPYQDDALARIAGARTRGVKRQLGVAATGLGKTVIFCSLAERMGGRTLVLAHRDELISQAAAKVREVWPTADVGIVKASQNDVGAQVVVASVQTLARRARLDKLVAPFTDDQQLLGRADPFGLVVIDEAHHATAESYQRIIEATGCGQPDGPLLLGVTATPDRGDGKGLDKLFDEVVFSYDILWGIRSNYLANLRGLVVRVADLNMADVKVTAGDYNQGIAGRLMEDAHGPEVIWKAWHKHASDRRTLAFTPTVRIAELVAERFREGGVAAEMVHGGTPIDERRAILRRFSNGETQVLANCAVLTEGYDEPAVDCIVVARPTKSRALYVQMVGRGTRKHPDKDDCLVLDIVGATEEHSLVTIPSLFGIEKKHRKPLGDGSATITEVIEEQQREQVRTGRLTAREVELFNQVRSEGIAWVKIHKRPGERRRYIRPLGKDPAGEILPTVHLTETKHGEGWLCGIEYADGTKRVLIDDVTMEMAQGVGEDFIRKNRGSSALTDTDAAWRQRKPTDGQKRAASKWRFKVDPTWNAGELADALDQHIARIKARQKADDAKKAKAAQS